VLGQALSQFARIVVCVDTSWAMLHAGEARRLEIDALLEQSRAGQRGAVVRVTGSARALAGAAHAPFDLILAVGVLEYQRDVERFLSELNSILRPGGFLVLTVPNHRSVVRLIERPLDALAARTGKALRITRLEHRSYSSSRPFGSKVPWRDALSRCGLRCQEVHPIPLGGKGMRAAVKPNYLVVAQRR